MKAITITFNEGILYWGGYTVEQDGLRAEGLTLGEMLEQVLSLAIANHGPRFTAGRPCYSVQSTEEARAERVRRYSEVPEL